ncbi:MAG: hypothetical protein RIB47_08725 [Cyclobacteriaceae bacterium]
MDIQFWIWVIVVVITLIARANKKKNAQPPEPQDTPNRPQRPEQKPISFEDLLREIQGEKAVAKAPPKPPKKEVKEYDFVDYDDDIPDEIQDLEDVDYDFSKDQRASERYEAAKKMAKESPLIMEKTTAQESLVRLEHFRGYRQSRRKKLSFGFLNEIKDPNGFKKAFIMSEILNRKY